MARSAHFPLLDLLDPGPWYRRGGVAVSVAIALSRIGRLRRWLDGEGSHVARTSAALQAFHVSDGITLNAGLHVVADLSGTAAEAATAEDYLIPPSLLGATISGLVSRSILNTDVVGPQDFHGCVQDLELVPHDLSHWFLDVMTQEIERQLMKHDSFGPAMNESERQRQQQLSQQLLVDVADRFGVRNPNHVKPGIGEATRVMLRRVPSHLLLRSPTVWTCGTSASWRTPLVPVLVDPHCRIMPWH